MPLKALFMVLLLLCPSAAAQSRLDGPCGTSPKGKPKRIKGGEAYPPLPLPATPLRRTERKRNPSPPVLIGKVQWGEKRNFETDGGRKIQYHDWNNDPSDLTRLLEQAKENLNLRYKFMPLDLEAFSFDPDQIPILWITGTRAPVFSPAMRAKIRDYLEDGGSLWGDACRGSPLFTQGFRKEIRLILPSRILRPLAADHPVFRCAYDLKGSAKYTEWAFDQAGGAPYLEGVNIGCRTAVFFSPHALSCAWDSGHVREGCAQMLEESALPLGLNMLAYVIAYRPLGRFLSRPLKPFAADPEPGGFVLAQARFSGEYNPDPSAFGHLLQRLSAQTSVDVALEHPFVSFHDERLFDHPFIYMTGHGPFQLGEKERQGLAAYLRSGGFLFVDACCSDMEFDVAFRALVDSLFTPGSLKEIPLDDPLYQAPEKIESVRYTLEGAGRPMLEGVAMEGAWRIVYSRVDVGCGWEGEAHPYRTGVLPDDAIRIAVNVIIYAMAH